MKVTIKNDHPVPMEVMKAGVILKPGESIVLDVPDTDDKPKDAAAPEAAAAEVHKPAKGSK